jgi:DNA phosphorothioation-dependent restriction protein DptH
VGIGLTDVDQSTVDRVKGLPNHHCLYKTFDVRGEIIHATPFFEMIDKQKQ